MCPKPTSLQFSSQTNSTNTALPNPVSPHIHVDSDNHLTISILIHNTAARSHTYSTICATVSKVHATIAHQLIPLTFTPARLLSIKRASHPSSHHLLRHTPSSHNAALQTASSSAVVFPAMFSRHVAKRHGGHSSTVIETRDLAPVSQRWQPGGQRPARQPLSTATCVECGLKILVLQFHILC